MIHGSLIHTFLPVHTTRNLRSVEGRLMMSRSRKGKEECLKELDCQGLAILLFILLVVNHTWDESLRTCYANCISYDSSSFYISPRTSKVCE